MLAEKFPEKNRKIEDFSRTKEEFRYAGEWKWQDFFAEKSVENNAIPYSQKFCVPKNDISSDQAVRAFQLDYLKWN